VPKSLHETQSIAQRRYKSKNVTPEEIFRKRKLLEKKKGKKENDCRTLKSLLKKHLWRF
jgi:hypothetical protein